MPLYAYRCDDCKEQFSVFLSYADYGKKTVNCVYCGSARIHRKIDRIRIAKPGRKDFSSGPLPSGPEDTEDPRMLGRMLREAQQQSGEPMPADFDEVVGRLENGDSIAAIDQEYDDSDGGSETE